MNTQFAGLAAVAAIAAIGLAPVAHAAPGDASFVQQLNDAGIRISDPPSLVGNTGRQICSLLENGWTVSTASYAAKGEYDALTESQTRQFVLIAQQNYCPNL